MVWNVLLPAAFNAIGGMFGNSTLSNTQQQIQDLTAYNPYNANVGIGGFQNQGGTFNFNPSQGFSGITGNLAGSAAGLLGGGLYNDPTLQQALQGNNLAGAFQGAQAAQGIQASPFFNPGAFGQNYNNVAQLAQMAGQGFAAGPQDYSGGAQAGLFAGGLGNLAAAGNTSGLVQQNLDASRALAAPQENNLINRVQSQLFAQGRLGTTGGAQQFGEVLGQLGLADQQRIMNAQQLGLQNQQQLGQLGLGQIGQGSGLLGQNLQTFMGLGQQAQGFGGLLGNLEGQGFDQMLRALQQGQGGAQQQLQNAMGLFGLGTSTLESQLGLGGTLSNAYTNAQQLPIQTVLGLLNAEANRISGTQGHAQALGQGGQAQAGLLGGLFGGIGDALGGLF